jgi:hypothetical protein
VTVRDGETDSSIDSGSGANRTSRPRAEPGEGGSLSRGARGTSCDDAVEVEVEEVVEVVGEMEVR